VNTNRMHVLVIILIVFLAMWSHGGVAGQPSRDILHRIVARCLDSSLPDYCLWCPAPLRGQCAMDDDCRRTTEVWAQTDEYVVIRDIKMCGCPANFVHGLAMARTLVAGVEDPKRLAHIWPFAWTVARQRIPDEMEIGLAVNPAHLRSQDYLHVHLVRLRQDARKKLVRLSPLPVERLEEVWNAGARHATGLGLRSYGVIVARSSDGNFLVVADGGSPERKFTQYVCR
jgi:CDP-diacylglycerol pyrophosphatase